MSKLGIYDTQRLTRASFEPAAVDKARRRWLLLAVVALLLAGSLGLVRADKHFAGPRLAALTRHNAELTAEAERARLDLEMERATRAELQRQIDTLNAQVSELNHQLGFVNSQASN